MTKHDPTAGHRVLDSELSTTLGALLGLLVLSVLDAGAAAAQERSTGEKPVVDLGGIEISLGANPVLGEAGAPVTLVEFLDFQCGFCARQLAEMMPRLEAEYIETGLVRYVELDYPLTKIHPRSMAAARAGHCARDQDRYWGLRDRMLEPGADLDRWEGHVAALALDGERFERCLAGPESAAAVRADQLQGRRLRVPGTPTLVIAKSNPRDATRVDGLSLIAGSKSWAVVAAEIERALAKPPAALDPAGVTE